MSIGVLYTVISALLYGCIGYFGVHLMQAGFSVSGLLFWRFFIAALLLFPFALRAFKEKGADLKNMLLLFFMGNLFYGGSTACYFAASKTIGTGLAMVIFFTYPIFVASLSIACRKASLNIPTVASLTLIILGLSAIAFGETHGLNVDTQGLTLALAAGLGYGLYLFGSKESSQKTPPELASGIVCLGNAFAFGVYMLLSQESLMIPKTFEVWSHIILFALVGTVLPIFFLLQGMKTLSANKAAIISVLEPVTVLAVGALVLAESVTAFQLQGAGLILLSAIVIQFDKEPKQSKALQLP